MISVPGIYVLIFVVFIFALSAAYQIGQYRKRLRQYRTDAQKRIQAIQNRVNKADTRGIEQQLQRQHQENAWARGITNKKYESDKTDRLTTLQKSVHLLHIITLVFFIFASFYYPTYVKKLMIKLAQNPANIQQGCLYYGGLTGKEHRIYFIEGKKYEGDYDILIEKFPAYQKFRTHRFEKNRCYKIKYIKITIPIFNTERIYVYDINL